MIGKKLLSKKLCNCLYTVEDLYTVEETYQINISDANVYFHNFLGTVRRSLRLVTLTDIERVEKSFLKSAGD